MKLKEGNLRIVGIIFIFLIALYAFFNSLSKVF